MNCQKHMPFLPTDWCPDCLRTALAAMTAERDTLNKKWEDDVILMHKLEHQRDTMLREHEAHGIVLLDMEAECNEKLEDLRRENERLREALDTISEHSLDNIAAKIAKDALKGEA